MKGTEASRKAAELACALAQSGRGAVDVLYVVDLDDNRQDRRAATHRLGRDVLADMDRIADRYEVPLRKHVRVSDRPAEAVLRQASRAGSDLIILGTDVRASDAMPFGPTADALLARPDIALALLTG